MYTCMNVSLGIYRCMYRNMSVYMYARGYSLFRDGFMSIRVCGRNDEWMGG